jgi:hypothetical protein
MRDTGLAVPDAGFTFRVQAPDQPSHRRLRHSAGDRITQFAWLRPGQVSHESNLTSPTAVTRGQTAGYASATEARSGELDRRGAHQRDDAQADDLCAATGAAGKALIRSDSAVWNVSRLRCSAQPQVNHDVP